MVSEPYIKELKVHHQFEGYSKNEYKLTVIEIRHICRPRLASKRSQRTHTNRRANGTRKCFRDRNRLIRGDE
jgi:hypothetical protein